MYLLIYPDGDVTLADLARAALAECGSENVSVVSGMGTQVIRVPEGCADRVMRRAGLVSDDEPEPPHAPPQDPSGPELTPTPKSASAPAEAGESPGADAPTSDADNDGDDGDEPLPGRPAGRAADRTAKKTSARRTGSRRKEG
ncbi:hypothetical protein AB0M39_35185 [Streptomyces sp. NPDC051907]|uniref:hypothetical protein n=1 Tax=Streptomyces sp. NPDC051907 TaxID=3155284 RepID=UPI0034392D4D